MITDWARLVRVMLLGKIVFVNFWFMRLAWNVVARLALNGRLYG